MMGSRSDNGQGKSSQVDYIRYQRHNHTCMHPDILNGQSFMSTNQYVNTHVNQTINQHVQPFNLATKLSSPNSLEYFVVSNQFHSSSRHLVARDGYSNNFKETNEDDASPLPCFIEPEIFPSSSKSAAVMSSKPHVFPAFFNPRKAANMPANEKVHNWMVNIPYHYQNNKLHMDCFPAVTSLNVSSSGNSLDSDQPEEYGLKTDIYNEVFPDPARSKNVKSNQVDFSETDAILEFQARKITRYILKIYDNEPENVALGDYRGGERMHCKQNLQDDVYEEESYYDDDEDEIAVETTDGKYFGRYLGTGNGI